MMYFSKYLFCRSLGYSMQYNPSPTIPLSGEGVENNLLPCEGGGWEGVNVAILYDGIFTPAASLISTRQIRALKLQPPFGPKDRLMNPNSTLSDYKKGSSYPLGSGYPAPWMVSFDPSMESGFWQSLPKRRT
jgi:hypothetical protein